MDGEKEELLGLDVFHPKEGEFRVSTVLCFFHMSDENR